MHAMARPGCVGGSVFIVAAALLLVVGTAQGICTGPNLCAQMFPCGVSRAAAAVPRGTTCYLVDVLDAVL